MSNAVIEVKGVSKRFGEVVAVDKVSFKVAAGKVLGLVTTATGFAFSWLRAAIAAKVRQPDMVGMLSMFWLFPLMLASTAFTPADTMPSWLRPFAANQPISVAADAVRGLCEGTAYAADLLLTGTWTIGLLAVLVPPSARLYTRDAS